MVTISKQKIYDSLMSIKQHYHSFDQLVLFVSYTPYIGIRLNVRVEPYASRSCWMKDTIEVTDCLKEKDDFDKAESIAFTIDSWIKANNF